MVTSFIVVALIVTLTAILLLSSKGSETTEYLRFNNTPLVQVIEIIENQYDVQIEIERGVTSCRFTGSFFHTKDINEILRALDEALNLEHKILAEGEYQLTGAGCFPVQ